MKKIFNYIIIVISFALFFSCEDSERIYDGPVLGSFTSKGDIHYIYPTLEDKSHTVEVGITTVADGDKTFDIEITGTAVEGTQYTVESKSVTVKAGEVVGSLKLDFLLDGFEENQSDTLNIKLVGSEVADFKTDYSLVVKRVCPLLVDEDLLGDYSGKDGIEYGEKLGGPFLLPLNASIKMENDTFKIVSNIGDAFMTNLWGDIIHEKVESIVIDFDKQTGLFTIPLQDIYTKTEATDKDGNPTGKFLKYKIQGKGVANLCNSAKISIKYELIQDSGTKLAALCKKLGYNKNDYFVANMNLGGAGGKQLQEIVKTNIKAIKFDLEK